MVFEADDHRDHEQISYFSDDETGLQAIVAVHDTTLGPALGGTRIYDYETEDDGLRDVLRLSRAMTYKSAAADLDLGGKAVVLGDPSPITAHGVLNGLGACVEYTYGTDTLSDVHVAIQGVGKVGGRLAAELADRGAAVTVTDIDGDAVGAFTDEHDVEAVPPDEIYDVSCDIFAPCAFGGAVNDTTIPRLDCDVVAGAANNILDSERHAQELKDEGILYAEQRIEDWARTTPARSW